MILKHTRNIVSILPYTAILLSGCASVTTKNISPDKIADGFTYSVPIQYADVSLTRKITPIKTLLELSEKIETLETKHKNSTDVANALAAKQAQAAQLVAIAISRNIDGDTLTQFKKVEAELSSELATARVDEANILTKLNDAKTAYQTAIANGGNVSDSGINTVEDTLNFELLGPVADTRYRFVANFPHSVTRSETHNIKVNNFGLLQSADLEASDKTGLIMTSVASAVALGGQSVPVAASAFDNRALLMNKDNEISLPTNIEDLMARMIMPLHSKVQKSKLCEDDAPDIIWSDDDQNNVGAFVHKETINPSNPKDIEAFNERICKMASNLSVDVMPLENTGSNTAFVPSKTSQFHSCFNATSNSEKFCNGFMYKRLLPVRFSLNKRVKNFAGDIVDITTKSQTENIPNGAPLDSIGANGSMFTTRTAGLKFDNGILIDFDVERPSEINEMASATLAVFKAPFEIISEVVTLNVETAKGQQAIAQAALDIEKARIEQQNNLTKSSLESDINIETLNATRDKNLALALLEGDTALNSEFLTQERNRIKFEEELFAAQLQEMSQSNRTSNAELEQVLETLKKRKDILTLQKEIRELEADND